MKEEKELIGQDINFERIRRITGYLVGTTDKWNNAKKAELNDRVVHDKEVNKDVHSEYKERNSTEDRDDNDNR